MQPNWAEKIEGQFFPDAGSTELLHLPKNGRGAPQVVEELPPNTGRSSGHLSLTVQFLY